MTIAIVGGSIGGMTTATTLRRLGYEGQVIVVDADPEVYARPSLSKAAMRGEAVVELDPDDDGLDVRRGVRATRHDPETRTLVLSDSERVIYDRLVIATGARARRLRPDVPGEFVVRGLGDVRHLRVRLAGARSVLVVGAGLLGMELASACRELGHEVTVVANEPPLHRVFGAHLGDWLRREAEAAGIRIVDTIGLASPVGEPISAVELDDGRVLEADVIITAVGDVPDVNWTPLGTSGVGIVTDADGWATSDVMAVGDARATRIGDRAVRDPHWQAAIDGGRAAAHALLGLEAPPAAPRYVWTECFGHILKMAGPAAAGAPTRLVDGEEDAPRLLEWGADGAPTCAAAIDLRIPIPRLRARVDLDVAVGSVGA
ncbi:NAD(P)/FAD-dependent oxidoreductase [Pseudolysinimonas sp.]